MDNKKRRPVFGLLIGQLEESYLSLIWPGVTDYAENNNIDLVIFTAKSPASPNGWDFEHNIVNDYIIRENIDGLIIITGEMSDYFSYEQIKDICNNFKDIPIISLGYPMEEFTSILIDNKPGLIEALDHLHQKHNITKIGFIKGTEGGPDSEERFDVYKDYLAEHDLEFNKEYVFQGNFSYESGQDAAHYFIDKLNNEVEAVVSSDDIMALGFINIFEEKGYKIPDDLLLIGFDDIETGRYLSTPLTTINQPLYEMGWQAGEFLKMIILGETVPGKIYLPTSLKVRQTCGCLPSSLPKSINFRDFQSSNVCLRDSLNTEFKNFLISRFLNEIKCNEAECRVKISKLMDSLFSDFMNDTELTYINELNYLINSIYDSDIELLSFQTALLNTLRLFSWKISDSSDKVKYNYFTQVSETIIFESLMRKQEQKRVAQFQLGWETTEVMGSINNSLDFDILIDNILEDVPRLDLNTFYLTLYKGSDMHITNKDWKIPYKSSLLLAYEDGEVTWENREKLEFQSTSILPDKFKFSDKRRSIILMPLIFNTEQFGLMIFEFEKDKAIIYENIRTQVSSALKVSLLFKEREEAEEELRKAFARVENANVQLLNISIEDELTGLYNRRGFLKIGQKEYQEASRSKGRFVLFFLDLDGLKSINDTFGHDAGDKAIIDFAGILKKVFREKDVIARLAGDEFTVIAIDAHENIVANILNRLKTIILRFNETSKKPYNISASIGYSVFNEGVESSFEDLITIADENLYKDKKRKKGII